MMDEISKGFFWIPDSSVFSAFLSKYDAGRISIRNSISNLLPLSVSVSVSMECLDTDSTKDNLVKQVAILNCGDKKWSSVLCILGLSSVLCRNIHTYYPDAGVVRYKLFFNRLVQPCQNPQKGVDDIHILFCHVMA